METIILAIAILIIICAICYGVHKLIKKLRKLEKLIYQHNTKLLSIAYFPFMDGINKEDDSQLYNLHKEIDANRIYMDKHIHENMEDLRKQLQALITQNDQYYKTELKQISEYVGKDWLAATLQISLKERHQQLREQFNALLNHLEINIIKNDESFTVQKSTKFMEQSMRDTLKDILESNKSITDQIEKKKRNRK
jgi:hypothetical protein